MVNQIRIKVRVREYVDGLRRGESGYSEAELWQLDWCGADLAGANLSNLDLSWLDMMGADFTGANLSGANLAGAKLTEAILRGANLHGAELAAANLARADLSGANLKGVSLWENSFSGANLRGAIFHWDEIPYIPNIDQAILSAIESGGKLDMEDWHICETAHCRAGWAITLAGEAGKRLEQQFGADAAAAFLYAKSDSHPVPNWFVDEEMALADIRKRAVGKRAQCQELVLPCCQVSLR